MKIERNWEVLRQENIKKQRRNMKILKKEN